MPRQRQSELPIDPMFLDRWSPRAFSSKPLDEDQIRVLFEAARWAPSCYNEQPWLFRYARSEPDLARFRSLLVEGNRVWAGAAPLLILVLARRHFARTGEPNRWAEFDCGAAWMSLALQARRLGLYTHAMAGFDESKTYEVLGISREAFSAVAMIAVGRLGDPRSLPEKLASGEHPNNRRPLERIAAEG